MYHSVILPRVTFPGAPSYGGVRTEDMGGGLPNAGDPRVG